MNKGIKMNRSIKHKFKPSANIENIRQMKTKTKCRE